MFLGNRLGTGRVRPLGGFSPSDIANQVLWLDAGDAVSLGSPTNLDAIASWLDLSVGGNDATQGTGVSQPIYNSTGFGTNSTPYLDFDGSNDFLTLGTAISKLANHTVFVACEFDVVNVTQCVICEFDSGGASATSGIALRNISTGITRSTFGDGTNNRSTNSTETNSASTEYLINSTYTSGQGKTELRRNAVDLTESTSGTATSIGGTAYNMSIGRLGDFNGQYFNGKVAEILVYSDPLTSGEITSVEGYLNAKHGIY